ncbi:peptide deformylase [Desulfuromonas soudanensis]|uniref:Peptide deformylase n=1 Tax=Desulfuromonas soudanensis TaxID=1603606 RepID=A0A0M4DJS2_9BACT|nr:peptide deformylase [Desulfuromonas soudanensis]ALC17407.1 peptide deformylase [Desulfuromonas soudanensis]
MAVRDIILYPDPILKTVCAAVPHIDAASDALVQDLLDTMIDSGHSVGVAAPQIGVSSRVVVVDVSGSKLGRNNNHGQLVLINPEILERQGSETMREGCMSVPDYTGNVIRATEIVLQFLDRAGTERVIKASGFEAVAIQHEIDHLDGILFLDRVSSLKTDVFRRK